MLRLPPACDKDHTRTEPAPLVRIAGITTTTYECLGLVYLEVSYLHTCRICGQSYTGDIKHRQLDSLRLTGDELEDICALADAWAR